MKEDNKKELEISVAQINMENQRKFSDHIQRFPPKKVVNPQSEMEKEMQRVV